MFVITAREIDGDFSYTHGLYEFKDNADFECSILNQLEGEYPNYYFSVNEIEVSDSKVNKNDKVAPFYMYLLYTDDDRNPDDYNDDETILKRYSDKTSFIERDNQSIIGYSINSFEEAKKLAFDVYSKEMIS